MTCRDAKKALILNMVHLPDAAAGAALDSHCAACAECAREGARIRALAALLTDARAGAPSESVSASSAWRLPPAPMLRRRTAWAIVALALALVTGFTAGWTSRAQSRASRATSTAPEQLQIEAIEASGMPDIGIRYSTVRQASLRAPVGAAQSQRLLLEAIQHPANAGMRIEAMRLLASLGRSARNPAALRQALLTALRDDPNPGVRLRALDGLQPWVAQPSPDAALLEALAQAARRDPNRGVQAQAVRVLAAAPNSAVLLRRLGDNAGDPSLRWSCAAALHQQGDPIPAEWLDAAAAVPGGDQ
ncbi:MAG TPA: hypothetical protein VN690_12970 [Terriglobales bacterium]|nr:hypothetical protein [Terriglobales bacterium]